MANSSNRFFGKIGYIETTEVSPGVWEPGEPVERDSYGYIDKNFRRLGNAEKLGDDIVMDNVLRIVADDYAIKHFVFIRYAVINDIKWSVKSVEVRRPELVLYLGEMYNGS